MPVPARFWSLNDYLTASRLNGELFRTNGLPFAPNGTGFHAARPIYKSTGDLLPTIASGVWKQLGSTISANAFTWPVLADTGALFGSRFDPIQGGTIFCNVQNSGGQAGTPGGLGLVSTFVPFTSGTGYVAAAIGQLGLSSPLSIGTGQLANGSFSSAPWAMDIADLNGNGSLSPYAQSTQATPTPAFSSDGSGTAPRFQSHWVSVYPANGTRVSVLPSLTTSYSGSTPLTSALLDQNIQQMMALLNMPPLLRVFANASTTAASGSLTTVNFPAATYDTYGGWSAANDRYTVPLPGIYLVAGFTPFGLSGSSPASHVSAALLINGNTVWGPSVSTPASPSNVYSPGKVGIFDLAFGDTIQLAGQQQTGLSGQIAIGSTLIVLYLGAQGIGSPVPSVPDPNYFFAAGTPASALPGVLSAHMGNDLNFLLNRPYFLGYQATAQTGATQGANTALAIDTTKGLIHGTQGDPWGGINGGGWINAFNHWVAPVPGWYLAVEEIFGVPPTQANASCQACFNLFVPGISSPDIYQVNPAATGVSNTGAAAVGYYFLRAGDWIQPQFADLGTFASGTVGTNVAAGVNSHFEICWLGS